MIEQVVVALLVALALYLLPGLGFAVMFVLRGVDRIDPRAEGGSWGFRLAILPASVVLWPLLVRRWVRGQPPPEERNAHRQRPRREESG